MRQGTPLSTCVGPRQGNEPRHVERQRRQLFHLAPPSGDVLQFRLIGTAAEERTVGAENVHQRAAPPSRDEPRRRRRDGARSDHRAARTRHGAADGVGGCGRGDAARELRQRAAGACRRRRRDEHVGRAGRVDVITIRGVSSISEQQPAADDRRRPADRQQDHEYERPRVRRGRLHARRSDNRGVDFTNRAADINPEDIESHHGAEGTGSRRRSTASTPQTARSSSRPSAARSVRAAWSTATAFRVEQGPRAAGRPAASTGPTHSLTAGVPVLRLSVRRRTRSSTTTSTASSRTANSQSHNLTFSGGADRMSYRCRRRRTRGRMGVVPNSDLNTDQPHRCVAGAGERWLNADLSMMYTYANNDQPFKGDNEPAHRPAHLADDRQREGLADAGRNARVVSRRCRASGRSTIRTSTSTRTSTTSQEQPDHRECRLHAHAVLVGQPQDEHRHRRLHEPEPDSASIPRARAGSTQLGMLENWDDVTRKINAQTVFNINSRSLFKGISVSGLFGNATSDYKSTADDVQGPTSRSELRLDQQHAHGERLLATDDRAAPPGQRLRQRHVRLQPLSLPDGDGSQRLDVDDPDAAQLVLLSVGVR